MNSGFRLTHANGLDEDVLDIPLLRRAASLRASAVRLRLAIRATERVE